MKTILLEMTICGFKCINKPMTIQFTNKIFSADILDKSVVKAIYGTNGEGKSAIVHAVDIYKKTVLDKDYLTVENSKGSLNEIINKHTKKANITLKYYVCDSLEQKKKFEFIFKHTINYFVSNNDEKVYIESEELDINESPRSNYQRFVNVFKTKDGEISSFNKDVFGIFEDEIRKSSMNLMDKSSFLNSILSVVFDQAKIGKNSKKFNNMILIVICALSMSLSTSVYLDEKDSHKLSVDRIREHMKKLNDSDYIKDKQLHEFKEISIDNETDKIDENYLKAYKEEIKKICNFIKVFKPELKEIKVEADPIGGNKLICKKIFVYEDGNRISSEYESSGIKKLMKLYPILNNIELGGIAFIDEFDSNIHDVYLCKLIEYVIYYTKGQLVFTTHNLGPMEILDKSDVKHAVDFLNQSVVTSWKKNGNYSIVKVYRGGAIPNCPFNIDAADFAKVFGDKM